MRIGVYLDNEPLKGMRFGNLSEGNPGIGGTEYCVLFLCQELAKQYPNDDIFLFCSEKTELASVDNVIGGYSIISFIKDAAKYNLDVCLISYNFFKEKKDMMVEELSHKNLNIILWGHNYYFEDDCNLIADLDSIKANVFVGRQQYDHYIDHRIINKSTYIYNMYPEQNVVTTVSSNNNVVTYIGSLICSKGFHVLAKQWKKIIKKVPSAQLYVIGNGKLYNRKQKMGKFDIAEESYENSFIPCLLNSNGELLKSVHFLGVLGSEKKEIIKKTKVGVVNPTARTETFGISALDFEAYGVPVVTKSKGGFLDTVVNKKTGLLYFREKHLYKKVVKLLLDNHLNTSFGRQGAEYCKKFAPDSIAREWHKLFEDVVFGKKIEFRKPKNFYFRDLKIFRIANRNLKRIFKVKKGMSLIGLETKIWRLLHKKK